MKTQTLLTLIAPLCINLSMHGAEALSCPAPVQFDNWEHTAEEDDTSTRLAKVSMSLREQDQPLKDVLFHILHEPVFNQYSSKLPNIAALLSASTDAKSQKASSFAKQCENDWDDAPSEVFAWSSLPTNQHDIEADLSPNSWHGKAGNSSQTFRDFESFDTPTTNRNMRSHMPCPSTCSCGTALPLNHRTERHIKSYLNSENTHFTKQATLILLLDAFKQQELGTSLTRIAYELLAPHLKVAPTFSPRRIEGLFVAQVKYLIAILDSLPNDIRDILVRKYNILRSEYNHMQRLDTRRQGSTRTRT